ncbi:hypothetical protein ACIPZF_08395 [Pseudomonas sp. NPDC089752]|uniref:hypothetical protein n=1 Tax=Pseudomonas sp. NPDC089752 TaxID=3364472 RepID=UPI0037F40CB2
MSADQTIYEILKKFYSGRGNLPQADGLYPLFIADMDSVGRESEGLGWNELGDFQRHVPMVASLPEVIRKGNLVSLFYTTTRPESQPPTMDPAEAAIDDYELTQEVIDKRVLSFATNRSALNLPEDISDRPGYPVYFYYSLEDLDSQHIRWSPYREVLIDLAVPGGLIEDTNEPINSHLVAPVVVIVHTQPPTATLTIEPWKNQQEGDQVTVIWNGVLYRHEPRLQAGDIGKPFVIDVPNYVLIAGGDALDLPVQYEVRDRVQNYSWPSLPAFVDVAINPDALPEPEVQDTEEPDYEFDLDSHNGQTVRVSTLYDPAKFLKGDKIQLFMVATTSDGVEVPYVSEVKTVNTIANLYIDVPRVYFAFAASGAARLYYTSTPAATNSATRTSRTRRVRVVSAFNTLRPPVLVEANAEKMSVDLGDVTTGFFQVRIPLYPGQMAGDHVRVTLTGRPGNGLPLVSFVDGTVGGELTELVVPVTALLLRALRNGTLSMGYTVTNTGLKLPPRTSMNDPTYIVVDRNVPDFPALTCAQLQGSGTGVYLPTDTNFAEFVVPQDATLNQGDLVTFRFGIEGSETPPSVTWTVVFSGHPLSFILSNAQILPFDEFDVQAIYSTPRQAALG